MLHVLTINEARELSGCVEAMRPFLPPASPFHIDPQAEYFENPFAGLPRVVAPSWVQS